MNRQDIFKRRPIFGQLFVPMTNKCLYQPTGSKFHSRSSVPIMKATRLGKRRAAKDPVEHESVSVSNQQQIRGSTFWCLGSDGFPKEAACRSKVGGNQPMCNPEPPYNDCATPIK